MSSELTQDEADALLAMDKYCQDQNQYIFSNINRSLRLQLKSADGHEEFMLDIFNGKIELCKYTYNTRARKLYVLARLDIGGPPHRNPDGQEIGCPHLHLYREGYADKWAYPVPESFDNTSDAWQSLQDFMDYCNIKGKPDVQRGLFK